MNWPNKEDREKFEIAGFIEHYVRLSEEKKLKVVAKGEKPDYVVRCVESGLEYGVELTSVYLSDRSVPDQHIPNLEGPFEMVDVPFNHREHEHYKFRLLEAIQSKIVKARVGYDCSGPLILSVYVNEYTSIFFSREELEEWVKAHVTTFDTMSPFSEVVLWSMPNGGVFRVRPS